VLCLCFALFHNQVDIFVICDGVYQLNVIGAVLVEGKNDGFIIHLHKIGLYHLTFFSSCSKISWCVTLTRDGV
jgi:hypothetical protein